MFEVQPVCLAFVNPADKLFGAYCVRKRLDCPSASIEGQSRMGVGWRRVTEKVRTYWSGSQIGSASVQGLCFVDGANELANGGVRGRDGVYVLKWE